MPPAPSLPSRAFSLPRADLVWLAFVTTQALDGVFTYVGVLTIGLWIEANPLIAWCAHMFGPAAALTGVKLFAVACGVVLYLTKQHRVVAVLTLIYLVFAIAPWAHLLGS